jgi:hypothetical protein
MIVGTGMAVMGLLVEMTIILMRIYSLDKQTKKKSFSKHPRTLPFAVCTLTTFFLIY